MVIVKDPATKLTAKEIAPNCLILNFATAVAVSMVAPSVGPSTNGGDGFRKYRSSQRLVPL